MKTIYFHSEDLDGWLTEPNLTLSRVVIRFLASIEGLRAEDETGTHEVQIVLNSGKPADYLLRQAVRFGGEVVICGNGVGWQRVGEPVQRVAPYTKDWLRFRKVLGLSPDAKDVVRLGPLRWGNAGPTRIVEVALEEKRDAIGDLAISFFPEPGPVSHRWQFGPGIDRCSFAETMRRVIDEHGLALHVPPPHGDGAVDILPLVEGEPAGKWLLTHIAPAIFPDAELRITHAGDGLNDMDALAAEGVFPMTSTACGWCAEMARSREGVVVDRRPPGLVVAECYLRLAERGWYGPLSAEVMAHARTALGY